MLRGPSTRSHATCCVHITPSHHFDQPYEVSAVIHSLQNQDAWVVHPEGDRKQWSQKLTLLAQQPEPGIRHRLPGSHSTGLVPP